MIINNCNDSYSLSITLAVYLLGFFLITLSHFWGTSLVRLVACWITDRYHLSVNLGMGISDGCFIFVFASFTLGGRSAPLAYHVHNAGRHNLSHFGCFIPGMQVTVSDWQWLQNYSLAVRCADALSKRTRFPDQFLSQVADANFNKEDPNPLVIVRIVTDGLIRY